MNQKTDGPDDIEVPEGFFEELAELRAKTLHDVGWSSVGELHAAYVDVMTQNESMFEFLDWLIRMDEPGNQDRRTVTLTRIIEKAKVVRYSNA